MNKVPVLTSVRFPNDLARGIKAFCAEYHCNVTDALVRFVGKGLADEGRTLEVAMSIMEAQGLREELATLQERLHGMEQAAKAGEKAQAELRAIQEALEAEKAKPKSPVPAEIAATVTPRAKQQLAGQLGIISRADHLRAKLQAAVEQEAAGKAFPSGVPLIEALKATFGSYKAVLDSVPGCVGA